MIDTHPATAPEPSAAPATRTVRDLDRHTLTEPAAAALLDVRAVATLLDCSARHVYRLTDAGRMPPPVRIGALVRWRRADVQEWIDGGCRPVRRGV
jgi:excisionase family DNA binding protein